MALHMNVREPLYDVNKTLTTAFHYIIIQLSFHNPNTDIVLQWTQPEICVTSLEVSIFQQRKYMHSISIDETVLHGVWESFCDMRSALPELFLYIID